MNNRHAGLKGEDDALKYLLGKGYKLVTRNYKGRHGEIDLIMLDGDTIVFVEVKARDRVSYGTPEEAVTPEKMRFIINTAIEFVKSKRYYDYNMRFDVVTILRDKVTHYVNAFDLNSASYPMKYRM